VEREPDDRLRLIAALCGLAARLADVSRSLLYDKLEELGSKGRE